MPNEVLDYARAQDPQFKDVSDADLTSYLADRQPEFLQDPGFAHAHREYQAQDQIRATLPSPGRAALNAAIPAGLDAASDLASRFAHPIDSATDAAALFGHWLKGLAYDATDDGSTKSFANTKAAFDTAPGTPLPSDPEGPHLTAMGVPASPPPDNHPLQQIAGGAAETLPAVAAMLGLDAAGLPAGISPGLVMGTQAYQSSGGDLTKTAKAAALGLAMAPVGKFATTAAAHLIGSAADAGLEIASYPAAQKGLEQVAHQVALDTLFVAADSPEYYHAAKEDPEKAKRMLASLVGVNLALGLPGLMGITDPKVLSETQQRIAAEPSTTQLVDHFQEAMDTAERNADPRNAQIKLDEIPSTPHPGVILSTPQEGAPATREEIEAAREYPSDLRPNVWPTIPVPEHPETLAAQLDLVQQGKRPAMLVTLGAEPPADIPDTLKQFRTAAGTFIYDPAKLDSKDLLRAVRDNQVGRLLGYGIDAKPKPEETIGAVTVRNANGREIQSVATDEANLAAVTKAATQIAGEGDTISLEHPGDVIAGRSPSPLLGGEGRVRAELPTSRPSRTGWTTWHPAADGIPDVLDAIHEEGGIASPTQAAEHSAAGGEYDGYQAAMNIGMARRLRRSDGGLAPDQMFQALNHRGFGFETVDHMYEAVAAAAARRQGIEGNERAGQSQLAQEEAQRVEFEQAGQPRPAADPEPIGNLSVGDKFTLRGEKFEITGYDPDAETYTVQDGRKFGRQEIHQDAQFFPDKGSVEKGDGNPDFADSESPLLGREGRVRAELPGETVHAFTTPTAGAVHPLTRSAIPQQRAPAVGHPLPSPGPIRSWVKSILRPFQNLLAPQSIDHHARTLANILRENGGKAAIDLARANETLAQFRKFFDRTPVPRGWKYDPAEPLPRNFAFLDQLERGRANLPPELQDFAQAFDELFAYRIAEVRRLDPNALKTTIPFYFAHVWKDPRAAQRSGLSEQLGKAPLHGNKQFLRQRSVPYILDGLRRGLEPVSDNPVDLLLIKMHQMDKFILAERTVQEAKQIGLRKYLPAGRRVPEGWSVVNDPSSKVNGPPVVTIPEAFDAGIRRGLLDFMAKLGITHERRLKLPTVNSWGQYTTGKGEVLSRFGAPDSIIMHELGHALEERYGMSQQLAANSILQNELQRMADQRVNPSGRSGPAFRKYVNSMDEKVAEALRGYMYAPDAMLRIAPHVHQAVADFIQSHPALHDLNDIKPTMEIAQSKMDIPIPGHVIMGHWIMPDSAAQVLNNYLSPGLGRFAAYRTLRASSNLMNSAQLGLSAFHFGFTSLDASVSSAAVGLRQISTLKPPTMLKGAARLATLPAAPVTNYYFGKAVQQAMLHPGSDSLKVFGFRVPLTAGMTNTVNQVAQLAITAGLRATADPFYTTTLTRNVVRAFREGGAQGYGRGILGLPLAALEQTMRPITEVLVPRQKLGVFAQMAQHAMEQLGPGATHEQVREAMAKAADSTENRMGQMTYDNLFYNRMVKDLALIGFRAYGWQLGKYREALGAVADTATQAKRLASGQRPELTDRMAYVITLPMVVGAMGAMVNYLMTGQAPQNLDDYVTPRTGKLGLDGRPQRLMLPSYLKDLMSDWHDFPTLSKMGESGYHKLNPLISTTVDMLRNRDFYSVEIRHEDDPVWKQQRDNLAYVLKSARPFAVSGALKLHEENGQPSDYVLPFFGVVPAKKSLTLTPAEAKSADITADTLPAGTRTTAEFEHAQLVKTLVRDLRTNPALGQQHLRDAGNAGQLRPSDFQHITTQLTTTPLQYQVSRSQMTPDNAMRVWDLANPAERDQLRVILITKIANSQLIDQPTRARYLTQLTKPNR